MARPQKEGIDYFSLDTEMDDKVKLIEAKFGIAGFGILIKVWQIIYDNGYYVKWTEKELLLYKNRINADINLINDVINECLKWDIFNNQLYESFSILTSAGIQKRYLEAVKRRNVITLTGEFTLTPLPENFKPAIKSLPAKYITKVNVCNNSINVDINGINADTCIHDVDSGTQSKVKESKVNKIKVLKDIGDKPQTTKFIPPTIEQVQEYCKERNNTVDAEKFVNHYAASNWFRGKTKIKNWKACVITWEKNEKDKQPTYQKPKQEKISFMDLV